jgi:hypothetical protein
MALAYEVLYEKLRIMQRMDLSSVQKPARRIMLDCKR